MELPSFSHKNVDRELYDDAQFEREKAAAELRPYDDIHRNDGAAKDLMAALYRRKWDFTEECSDYFKKFIETMQQTEEYEHLREITVRRPTESFHAMSQLIPRLLAVKESTQEEKKSKARHKMRQALKKTIESTEELSDMLALMAGGGWDQSAQSMSHNHAEDVKIAKKLLKNSFVKDILRLIGRAISAANTFKQSSMKGVKDLVGVEFGQDLPKILPHEIVLLDVCPDLFYLKFIERKLMQYKFEGNSEEEGPVIAMIDESSSMCGMKNIIAKAFLFAMWTLASSSKRAFYVIRFNWRIQCQEIKSNVDIMKIIDTQLGGGTDFDKPLEKMMELVEKDPKWTKADGVFITDGEGHVDAKLLERIQAAKKRMKFSILTALMHEGSYDQLDRRYVEPFSDGIFDVSKSGLSQEKFLNEVMGKIG